MPQENNRELDTAELESVSGGGDHEMYMIATKHVVAYHATDAATAGRAARPVG